jgi:hypothetical protein
MGMEQEQAFKELGPVWTRQLLERCTPRELLVICAAYGTAQVARRLGYVDVEKFAQERQQQSKFQQHQ